MQQKRKYIIFERLTSKQQTKTKIERIRSERNNTNSYFLCMAIEREREREREREDLIAFKNHCVCYVANLYAIFSLI